MDLQRGLHDREMCLADSTTTHIIIRNKKYFMSLTLLEVKVNTIWGPAPMIEGFGRAMLILVHGIELHMA